VRDGNDPAAPDTMSQYRVDPENFHPDPPQEESIEQRIRQALDDRIGEGSDVS
jgi:hypothetical protein